MKGDHFAFANPVDNELWVVILEKAWCKLFTNYAAAEGGQPSFCLEYMTGAPVLDFVESWDKEFWNDPQRLGSMIMNCEHHQFMQSCGTRGQGEAQSDTGIISGHAYTILQADVYNNETILTLRNPWGKTEFKGKYDENNDEIWKDESLRKLLNYSKKDDGKFYMTIEEFIQNYDLLSICYTRPKYKIQSLIQIKCEDTMTCFYGFTIKSACEANLRVHQQFKKMSQEPDYDYLPIAFEIFQKKSNKQVVKVAAG